MRIGRSTNGRTDELLMQKLMCNWLSEKQKPFHEWTNSVYVHYWKDEVRVPEINRIPDFLVITANNQLVNIEAKSNPTELFMRQMKDNARYCDYTFAFIPDYCLTPKWFKESLIKYGFGLIVFNLDEKKITEVLEAHVNKGVNKDLRLKVMSRIVPKKRRTRKN